MSPLTACDISRRTIAFHMRTPTWCRHRAAEIGPACMAVIDELLAENALFRLRAAQGVLGLACRHQRFESPVIVRAGDHDAVEAELGDQALGHRA